MWDGALHHLEPSRFRAVVLAGSFGALEGIETILGALPPSFPLPVAVLQHRRAGDDGTYERILRWRSAVPISPWTERERLDSPGVRVVPARGTLERNHDCIVHRDGAEVLTADQLLQVAAPMFGRGLIAVVLTGRLDDGADGVRLVKRHGGRVLVQEPRTALAPAMPNAALATGCVDFSLPISHIAPAIVALALAPGADDMLRVSLPPWALSA